MNRQSEVEQIDCNQSAPSQRRPDLSTDSQVKGPVLNAATINPRLEEARDRTAHLSVDTLAAAKPIRPAGFAAVRPRVMMLGLRGIPNVQGGVEKHVEMLAIELKEAGWDVDVIGRCRYLPSRSSFDYKGIRVFPLCAPRMMALEAIVHTGLGVFFAAVRRPDILHIHAIGPALLVPLARVLGLKVVVTHHGYDYDRQKWGLFAKRMLRLGEYLGMRFSNERIAISQDIVKTIATRHKLVAALVPNGVAIAQGDKKTGILQEFGLQADRYILLAARFVEEKRQLDLIKAFAALKRTDVKLVLAGNAEFESEYARQVRALGESVPGVVTTGFQTGDRLAELFANAALFVLPSSHEGMPIALLEALAYGLPVLASDIVANRELHLAADDYFPLGDIEALAASMASKLANPPSATQVREQIHDMEATYSWRNVAQKTIDVYQGVLSK